MSLKILKGTDLNLFQYPRINETKQNKIKAKQELVFIEHKQCKTLFKILLIYFISFSSGNNTNMLEIP